MFDVKDDYLYHIGIFIINYNIILIHTCVHNLKASAIILYQTYNCAPFSSSLLTKWLMLS